MSSIALSSLLSVVLILAATFWLKKLWLGALAASALLLISQITAGQPLLSSLSPLVNALLLCLDLGLLLFGAYLFYDLLNRHQQLEAFEQRVEHLHSPLATLLLLCWFLLSFIEGIAGFGIPAMLVAPLLISLRLKALTAVLLPLIAGTVATTFGALSTPIRVGLNLPEPEAVIGASLLLNVLPGLLMPWLICWCYHRIEQRPLAWRAHGWLLSGAGLSFVLPYLLFGWLAPEFASVAGGLLGLVLFSALVIPKQDRLPLALLAHSFWPYLLFVLLLILGKVLLQGHSWQWHTEYRAISAFQPGLIFMLAAGAYLLLKTRTGRQQRLSAAMATTWSRTSFSILSILILVSYTQLIRQNLPALLAEFPSLEPLQALSLAVASGIAGSFLTGSATMSNLLFGGAIQQLLAGKTELLVLALALLNTGGAIGNCLSLQNILMVKTVLHQPIHESQIIGRALPVALVYAVLTLVVAYGLLNSGLLF